MRFKDIVEIVTDEIPEAKAIDIHKAMLKYFNEHALDMKVKEFREIDLTDETLSSLQEIPLGDDIDRVLEVYVNNEWVNLDMSEKDYQEGLYSESNTTIAMIRERKLIFPGALDSTDTLELFCEIRFDLGTTKDYQVKSLIIDLPDKYLYLISYFIIKELAIMARYFNEIIATRYQREYNRLKFKVRRTNGPRWTYGRTF